LPESDVFLGTYLREIGVQTPVSLVISGDSVSEDNPTVDSSVNDAANGTASVAQTVPVHPAAAVPDDNDSPPPYKTLKQLSEEAATCRLCALAETRQSVVFGVGNRQAANR